MDIHEKIKTGYYITKINHRELRKRPGITSKAAFLLERTDQNNLQKEFRKDAAEHVGLVDSFNLDPVWKMVRERRDILREQLDFFEELIELLEEMGANFGGKPLIELGTQEGTQVLHVHSVNRVMDADEIARLHENGLPCGVVNSRDCQKCP